ncbi:hypothetical protein HGA91_03560 [candidate division WWE3 bacterium]|nr:hypothetical protein [candidate division WWE3 bacterium]
MNKRLVLNSLVIFLIICAGGGYYYWARTQANPTTQQTFTPQNTAINWSDYTDANTKISFKYPSDWTVSVVPETSAATDTNETHQISIKSNGVEWLLSVDSLFTGFDPYVNNPDYCGEQNDNNTVCDVITSNKNVLEYSVEKRVYYRLADNKTYYVLFASPQNHGFGPLLEDFPRYNLVYLGDSIDANMSILDDITSSIRFN